MAKRFNVGGPEGFQFQTPLHRHQASKHAHVRRLPSLFSPDLLRRENLAAADIASDGRQLRRTQNQKVVVQASANVGMTFERTCAVGIDRVGSGKGSTAHSACRVRRVDCVST